MGQQLFQRALGAVAAQHRKVAGQAVVERFFVQRGFEVKLADVMVPGQVLDVGAGREHQRPRKPKMGEQRLAQLAEQRLAVAQQRQAHVAQREAHHAAAGRVGADEAAQAGLRRHDGMPGLAGQLVAAAVAAGGRVADAAGGDERGGRPQRLAAGSDNALADAVLQQQFPGGTAHELRVPRVAAQRVKDVGRAVALGEHAAAALGLERHAEAFEQLHGRRRRERVEAGIQKPPVVPHIGQKLPHVAVAGDVAAPLAGDEQFLPRAFGVVFQHRHAQPARTGRPGGHQAGGAAAHDQQIGHAVPPLRRSRPPYAASAAKA